MTIDFILCSIQENFVIKENVKIMQYSFCYKGIYKVYPESTIKLIKSEKLEHIIEKTEE